MQLCSIREALLLIGINRRSAWLNVLKLSWRIDGLYQRPHRENRDIISIGEIIALTSKQNNNAYCNKGSVTEEIAWPTYDDGGIIGV